MLSMLPMLIAASFDSQAFGGHCVSEVCQLNRGGPMFICRDAWVDAALDGGPSRQALRRRDRCVQGWPALGVQANRCERVMHCNGGSMASCRATSEPCPRVSCAALRPNALCVGRALGLSLIGGLPLCSSARCCEVLDIRHELTSIQSEWHLIGWSLSLPLVGRVRQGSELHWRPLDQTASAVQRGYPSATSVPGSPLHLRGQLALVRRLGGCAQQAV